MSIRAATVGDARAIAEVQVESWREAYKHLLPAAYFAELSADSRVRSGRKPSRVKAPPR